MRRGDSAETRIVDGDSGDTLNSGAKSAALSIFEGTKQRFFAQLLLSMKLPSLLPAMEAALADGNAVVVQLVSTAEAMLDRRAARLDWYKAQGCFTEIIRYQTRLFVPVEGAIRVLDHLRSVG